MLILIKNAIFIYDIKSFHTTYTSSAISLTDNVTLIECQLVMRTSVASGHMVAPHDRAVVMVDHDL